VDWLSTVVAFGIVAMLACASLFLDIPASGWRGKIRVVVLTWVLIAVAVTMTESTELVFNAGPLQIWGLISLEFL
jgi:peptidoglycan/LPS O-acetylase OafA/YrhL